jgi:hypothetical protein
LQIVGHIIDPPEFVEQAILGRVVLEIGCATGRSPAARRQCARRSQLTSGMQSWYRGVLEDCLTHCGQWRIYFTDVHPTGIGPQRQPGMFSASAPMAGYPKIYNIEMDPHEDLIVAAMFGWVSGPALKTVDEYMAMLKRYPNPPPPNITQFRSGG